MYRPIAVVCVSVLAVAVAQIPPEANIPSNYILDVSQRCGLDGNETVIVIKSDLDVVAKIFCRGGYVYECETSDGVSHTLRAYFDGDPSQRCVYSEQKDNVELYCVEVVATISSKGASAAINREVRYLLSCTYDKAGDEKSLSSDIVEQFHAPKLVQQNSGTAADMGVSVVLTDVLGQPLDPGGIPLDKPVCLKVYLDNTTGLLVDASSVSVFPVSCEAIGAITGARHAFLRSGCGDGMIIPKDMGFTMRPRMAVSPYFKFFTLENDSQFSIKCNFTVCTRCIGKNSCSGVVDEDKSLFDMFGEWLQSGNRLRRDVSADNPYPGVPFVVQQHVQAANG